MDQDSDEELMARVARGDAGAFRILAARAAPFALGIARRFLRDAADAEDVVQDAFLRVWTSAPRWRPTAPFRAWLYRIVINLAFNRNRRAPMARIDDAGDPVDHTPGALERMDADETRRMVAAAIDALPERQRMAVILTYDEGLSNAETALVLDTSVSGVESLLIRARRTLRATLGHLAERS
jgi:RNA polymerase sigma-70 factor (ECF subfamily)